MNIQTVSVQSIKTLRIFIDNFAVGLVRGLQDKTNCRFGNPENVLH